MNIKFYIFLFFIQNVLSNRSVEDQASSYDPGPNLTPKLVRITTADDLNGTIRKVNDEDKYSLLFDGYVFYYKFKDTSKCVEVEYSGNKIWNYIPDSSNNLTPNVICFHSDLNVVFIEFDDLLQMYRCTKDYCGFISDFKLDGFSSSLLKVKVEDLDNPTQSKEIYHTDFRENNHGFEVEHEFLHDVKCTEVIYKDITVWKYDSNEFNEHPTNVFINLFTKMIIINFRYFYLVYQYNGNDWKFLCKTTFSDFKDSDFTFMGHDTMGNKIDDDKYFLMKYSDGFTFVYLFKEDSNCTEVKYNNQSVWNMNELKSNYPKSLYVNLYVKMLLIETSDSFFVYMFVGEWKLIFKYQEKQEIQQEYQDNEEDSQPSDNLDDADPTRAPVENIRGTKPLRETERKSNVSHLTGKNILVISIIVSSAFLLVLILGLFFVR